MKKIVHPMIMHYPQSLKENEVIIPIKLLRKDISRVKAIKLSEEDFIKVRDFQNYLFDKGYIYDNTFSSLFVYLFNLAFTQHSLVANAEILKRLSPH